MALVPVGAAAEEVVLAGPAEESALTCFPWWGGDAVSIAMGRVLASDEGVPLDCDIGKIASVAFEQTAVQTLTAAAQQSEASISTFQRSLTRLACLCTWADRWLRASLERGIAASLPAASLLLYVDISTYDETPLVLMTKHHGFVQSGGNVRDVTSMATENPSVGILDTTEPLQDACVFKDPTRCKLFQTQSAVAMLVRIGDRTLLVRSASLHWLQALDRTTSETLRRALGLSSGVSPSAEAFKRKVRLVCVDKAGQNNRAEAALALDRPSWTSLTTFCHVHVVSTCHTKTFDLAHDCVSGAIHYALSLSGGAAMMEFRRALREEIAARFVVKFGRRTQAADDFAEMSMKYFLSEGSHLHRRRAVLTSLANGDWRDRGAVHVFVAPGTAIDETRLLTKWCNHVIWALGGKPPSTYPRHRWTGARLAFNEIALLEAVHGLASGALRRMLGKPSAAVAMAEDESAAILDSSAGDDGGASLGAEGSGATPCPTLPFQEQNAEHRRVAAPFVESGRIRIISALRVVLQPVSELLDAYLFQGGRRWEAQQRGAALRGAEGSDAKRTTYPALVAARGDLEGKCIAQLTELLAESNDWNVLHPDERTVENNEFIFRSLMRARALVFQLLAHVHEGFPWALFRLLDDESIADTLLGKARTSPCLLDSFTKAFMEWFPGDMLKSADARLMLLVIVSSMKIDIAHVEVGHGRVRRRVVAASNNTHTQMLEAAGAAWVFGENRRREAEARKLSGQQAFAAKSSRQKQRHKAAPSSSRRLSTGRADNATQRTRRGGGAWRAFVSAHIHNDSDFASLGRKYRQLSDVEKAYYKAEGRKMTQDARHREGENGGPARGREGATTRTPSRPRSRSLEEVAAI